MLLVIAQESLSRNQSGWITEPRSVGMVDFDEASKEFSILVDFKPSRLGVSGNEGLHPVHDTVTKTYRHLKMFRSPHSPDP